MTRIRLAAGDADLAAVRNLCWKYRDLLAERTRDVPGLLDYYYAVPAYEALLDWLAEEHARPGGAILVAQIDRRIVACGMTHPLEPGISELKRAYVDVAARGRGLARRLCAAAMDLARSDGFAAMKLDTMRRLPEAVALYQGMGFRPCPPFHHPPPDLAPHILFYGRTL